MVIQSTELLGVKKNYHSPSNLIDDAKLKVINIKNE